MTPRPMWQMIRDSESIRLRRFVLTLLGTFAALALTLLGTFAALALILAAVGIFGVASSVVAAGRARLVYAVRWARRVPRCSGRSSVRWLLSPSQGPPRD
jgi:preprotein translocase subunit SecF